MKPADDIHIEQLEWVAIPPELKPGLSLQPLARKNQKNWALVLHARGIPCQAAQTDRGRQLLVPADQFKTACEELKKYEHENRDWPPPHRQKESFTKHRINLWSLFSWHCFII